MKIDNILVTGRIYKTVEPLIRTRLNKQLRFLAEEEVKPQDFDWADAYVSFRPTGNFSFGGLKWVHSFGAGVDSFLHNRSWKKDVLLTRTVCSFGQKISEYCLSYMLRETQKHGVYQALQEQRQWNPVEPVSLSSQRVVIYGTGEIGQEVARTLAFFGAKPIGISLSGTTKPHFAEVLPASGAAGSLNSADWVISTLPLTTETEGMFNAAWFKKLQGACFMNVGRGATVDEKALLEALDHGFVRQAVLDVFAEEPLPEESALWQHPKVQITPHISAITGPEEAVQCFLDTLHLVEQGLMPPNRVSTEKGY
ncbi:D-2-hydroxyacid dehydrogenase [Ectobacillus ponti]|uniref:D-2-hydroxyacid dehydrogenase n=1 Tax=Ectobacillus ponti TaxID=2961894 RepID=A0AA41X9X4_9BACI|nr:D-2-hydroxyacid dehydrogenase [Ectobacillus ponti]MCP8969873.1 D-2-hydroxyacid dehydrogenase [Ectobacillus ponti]